MSLKYYYRVGFIFKDLLWLAVLELNLDKMSARNQVVPCGVGSKINNLRMQ